MSRKICLSSIKTFTSCQQTVGLGPMDLHALRSSFFTSSSIKPMTHPSMNTQTVSSLDVWPSLVTFQVHEAKTRLPLEKKRDHNSPREFSCRVFFFVVFFSCGQPWRASKIRVESNKFRCKGEAWHKSTSLGCRFFFAVPKVSKWRLDLYAWYMVNWKLVCFPHGSHEDVWRVWLQANVWLAKSPSRRRGRLLDVIILGPGCALWIDGMYATVRFFHVLFMFFSI